MAPTGTPKDLTTICVSWPSSQFCLYCHLLKKRGNNLIDIHKVKHITIRYVIFTRVTFIKYTLMQTLAICSGICPGNLLLSWSFSLININLFFYKQATCSASLVTFHCSVSVFFFNRKWHTRTIQLSHHLYLHISKLWAHGADVISKSLVKAWANWGTLQPVRKRKTTRSDTCIIRELFQQLLT